MKKWKSWLSALLAAVMLLSACAAFAEPAAQAAPLEGQLTLEDLEALGATAYTQDGRVTFVDGACVAEPVKDTAAAKAVVDAMVALLGGDARTQFVPWRTLTDAVGNRYHVFQQMYADTTVLGGAVKLVTDADGNMLGLVGSVESDLPDVDEAEGITAEAAEALVLAHMAEADLAVGEVVEGRTEKVILPVTLQVDFTAEDFDESNRFVWVVITNNVTAGAKGNTELPYMAHYVTMDGEYLYSLPTILPGDEAATVGYNAAYVFEFMEPVDYTGMVTLSDGTEQEISISLMRDSRTGMTYLANLERRIAVADCYEFLYDGGHVKLEASADNTGWDNTCLLSLYNYCRAWDYYHDIGWLGGDGEGTPMLILKDYCNSDRTPIDNAAYAGRFYGWQLFLSSGINDFSQCLDVIAHEFTHCVTGSVMTYNAYMNDYGAINEAMSDIQGNLCEMSLGATQDTDWLMGENGKNGAIRSMSDPHTFKQPAFSWDIYYVPNVKAPTLLNDQGGVHTNSSLLNNIAYRLCENGGMTFDEAHAFWFAVDCAMVPGTDYPQLGELMPWVLKNLGMDAYGDALEAALDATRLRTNAVPETFDDDRALLTLTLPEDEMFEDGNWSLMILSVDVEGIIQRVDDILNGAGEYADALPEILKALGIPEDAVFPQDGQDMDYEAILEKLFSALEQVMSETADKGEGEAEPAEEGESIGKDSMLAKGIELFRKYFGDLIYFGSGAAGQDGRTVRMVCQPGKTLPVLYRLEVDGDMKVHSVGLAVYTFHKWFDLGSFLAPFLQKVADSEQAEGAEANAADAESEADDLAWLDGLLGTGDGEAADGEADLSGTLDMLTGMMDKLSGSNWLMNQLFFTIDRGAVCEIPSKGLEKVASLTEEKYPFLKEMFDESLAAEPEAPGEAPQAQ